MSRPNSEYLADMIYNSPTSRRKNIPVNKKFVLKPKPDEDSPLQRIYVGGKSGALTLKLYLAIIGKAAKKPHTIDETPASSWAELLELEDFRGKGARKIKNSLRKLESLGFIRLEKNLGKAPTICLLSELGNKQEYELPGDSYFQTKHKKRSNQEVYFRISGMLLREGIFQELQGPGIVMLVILCAEQAYKKSIWFSTNEFPRRYGISSATRAKGTKELISAGVLKVTPVHIDEHGRTVSMRTKRIRNKYRLIGYAVPSK